MLVNYRNQFQTQHYFFPVHPCQQFGLEVVKPSCGSVAAWFSRAAGWCSACLALNLRRLLRTTGICHITSAAN